MIITIGRQFGSRGRAVGKALASAYGIVYYDKDLLPITELESGLDQNFLESRDERGKNSLLYSIVMGMGSQYLMTQENYSVDYLAKQAQYKAVQSVAQKGDCVIVGRCADYILRDRKDLVRVFLTAEDQDRAEHISERDEISREEAEKKMHRIDKERSMYYYCNTEQKWGSASSYDLCINTSKAGVDGTVKLIQAFTDRKK